MKKNETLPTGTSKQSRLSIVFKKCIKIASIAVVLLTVILNILLTLESPWREAFVQSDISILIIATPIAALCGLVAFIGRRFRNRDAFPEPSEWKIAIITVGIFVALQIWLQWCAGGRLSFLGVETGYYAILVLCGVLLAWVAHARWWAAMLVPTVILLFSSVSGFVTFMNSPNAGWRYGPELPFFAMRSYLERMIMWPLDLSFTWGAWLLTATFIPQTKKEVLNDDSKDDVHKMGLAEKNDNPNKSAHETR